MLLVLSIAADDLTRTQGSQKACRLKIWHTRVPSRKGGGRRSGSLSVSLTLLYSYEPKDPHDPAWKPVPVENHNSSASSSSQAAADKPSRQEPRGQLEPGVESLEALELDGRTTVPIPGPGVELS